MRIRTVCVSALIVAAVLWLPAFSAERNDPPYYSRKATWQETMLAARDALARQEAASETAEQKAGEARGEDEGRWSPWYHMGPFVSRSGHAFNKAYPPETEVDLNKPCGDLKWTPRPEWTDGVVHNLGVPGESATYLYRTVTVKSARKITAYFGSDDGMEFWLNGRKLISVDAPRGVTPGQNQAQLELVPGENRLLFKIYNNSGGCGFYFATEKTHTKGDTKRQRKNDLREGLWRLVQRDFRDAESQRQMTWEKLDNIWNADWPAGNVQVLAQRYAAAVRGSAQKQAQELARRATTAGDLAPIRKLYYQSKSAEEAAARWRSFNGESLRMAIQDLIRTYGDRYPRGPEYLARVDAIAAQLNEAAASGDPDRLREALKRLDAFRREAILSSPLIDFDKLLFVQRGMRQLGLPQNWQGNCALPKNGYDNQIAILSPLRPDGAITTVYKPARGEFVGDVDLHFDADRMLFSMPGANGRWQIFEIKTDGSGLRQVTRGEEPDVDNYDACYLPDGRIIYASTAVFHGVPCVGGGNTVANLFRMDADGSNARQLCFDQDHNWCPTVMHDGRILYSRWEYSDTPHYFTRLLFRMNPDGTGQMEYYGSNSYWPNSIFYARPIPGHPTKVVAVISGHHGVPRMGELVIFDPAVSQREAGGAVQRIPGYGKPVEPLIRDGLVDGSWPRFLHPYPLNEKYFLVSMQPNPASPWGIYLVDIFDNMVPILEIPGYAALEPIPLKKTPKPPVIPDRINPRSREATIYMTDVYAGDGLKGVPRGTVKQLRLYEFHYAYPGMGGHIEIGVDGPWDVHRILGTVPVYEDGSAAFKVPANTPIAVQPLDAEGRALQVMRSWYTAMPGEVLSCVGCHEKQSSAPPAKDGIAFRKPPAEITPWRGPARGFSFKRDVQPVLDKYCVGCHDGTQNEAAVATGDRPAAGPPPRPARGKRRDPGAQPDFQPGVIPDFSRKPANGWRNFTPSYLALHPYVRRPGPESDYHLQAPMEWHASTSELVQMLKKGHYNVKLDAEAWDRLYTWIDLNVPDHGTWSEYRKIAANYHQRRLEMRTKYANNPVDPEAIPEINQQPVAFVKPEPLPPRKPVKVEAAGWPFDASEARRRQQAAGMPAEMELQLGEGIAMKLVLIPAGEFVMGDPAGEQDEQPPTRVKIERAFYMGQYEVTNAQWAAFDPDHDSRYISVFNKDQSTPGEPVNRPLQPVVRVNWKQAMEFCKWLSAKTGRKITLPTEAQWEYACRAGTATPLNWGDIATDFGKLANLADERVNSLCRRDSPRWIPCVWGVNDGAVVTENVGKYAPNAFGLYDMHGNVWEWTRSVYRPYPYDENDGRNNIGAGDNEDRVVRGGSFYDRPHRARSAFRLAYKPYQKVFNVGFRVICEVDSPAVAEAAAGR